MNPLTPSARTPPMPSAGVPSVPGHVARPWAAGLASVALIWPAIAGSRWGPQRPIAGLWFRQLSKPSFQPPDALVPVAWTFIELALARGAYRLLRRPASSSRNQALGWWALNVGLIGGWSAVFFGRRNLPVSTVLAAAMVGSGAAYVVRARQTDSVAAAAGVPFVVWLGFATVLTAALWGKNR